jgi:hypothetical protein
VRFGLSPNLLDLMKNGHANLGAEQVAPDNKRVNLINNAAGDGPVRAFVLAGNNSSINAGATDVGGSSFTTVNRRNQAQTHQVEVAIIGNTTITLGFDQGSDVQQPADSDFDGMDDAWEITHFGDLSRDGSGDADSDSFTDRQEYVLGSNPNNASSGFPPLSVESGGNTFRVSFPTVAGRRYTVLGRSSLTSGDWSAVTTLAPGSTNPVTGDGNIKTVTETGLSGTGARFYRIQVELAP